MSKLCEFFLISILPVAVQFILVCGVFISKFIFWTTIVIFIDVILYVVFIIFVMEWRTKMKRERNKSEKEANEKAVDGLINFETVRNFIGEEHEQQRYSDALQSYMDLAVKAQSSISVLSVGKAAIIAVGQTLVLIIAAYELTQGQIGIGDFVLVNTFMSQLFTPLKSLGGSYKLIKESVVDIEQLYALLEEKSTVKDMDEPLEFTPEDNGIEFKNVSFSYHEDIPILKKVSFKVPDGKQLAIVGSSGGGKSTISKLLFRHYDVSEGQISIGGIDISKVRQKELRSLIGIVPQDSSLFNDTILYNLKYGSFNATEEEVIEATKIAKIYNFIQDLPDGWETLVGERGLRLSGGEKQRTVIARAILKNTPIMIFDEATSSLDTHTEREIQENIRRYFKGKKTSIVLAHRLSTIIDSDEIIVIKKGEIIERGTHDELLLKNGEYSNLWSKQSKGNTEIIQ
jgi:ATP-binding cassette, subfamily B, heavy metal transporter